MRSPQLSRLTLFSMLLALAAHRGAGAFAADVVRLSESTWEDAAPQGKEVDCIYGDWVLRNRHLVAVIAEALPSRNANMTVRNVGGSVIDLTQRDVQSDQLSAYYPLGGEYALEGPQASGDGATTAATANAKAVELTFHGTHADKHSTAEVTYQLVDDVPWLKITTRVKNTGTEAMELKPGEAIRADGEFKFGTAADSALLWAYDAHWRQAYGALIAGHLWRFAPEDGGRGDNPILKLAPREGAPAKLAPGETLEVVRYLFPAANTIEVLALAEQLSGRPLAEVALTVSDPDGPVDGAELTLHTSDGKPYAHGKTDAQGRLTARLAAGSYKAVVGAQGRGEKPFTWEATGNRAEAVQLPAPGYVVAKITLADGNPVPCKVQFRGRGEVLDPNFGPDSAIHGVRNVYYTANGEFRAPLAPGEYDVIISHGPEFDAVFTNISLARGKSSPLEAKLTRSVDTSGWLSADFHSHSTPSGDNTSSQRGRVLNLLAEHVEFAPCTEHNRLTVYDEHLAHFKATAAMLTCPGMELTGRPLPINHQNAFPLVPKPRTQDGGGPLTDVDPVVQIERLAMWDNGSEKLVQINHPNIPQILGDRDVDGSPDGGFEKMFSFMDVIEVHPLDRILTKPEALPSAREIGSAVFHWLQLANLGYRVPGVVNTDAHWNFHGSGWLRNYVKSASDDPAQATVPDLVHASEHGHIVMTNGPFLEVRATAGNGKQTALVGDDLPAADGKVRLKVRAQRPNWLEVNRVQVFVNGQPDPKLNFTARSHPQMFRQGTVAFDEELPIALATDAHLVVACVGEGNKLGPVMGPDHADDMPAAVSNPIFVDVDGNGFKPNGDMLGLPLPVAPDQKPSKGHHHHHGHEHKHTE
ncbi:MAG: CehA/McbA family metallohydrolase [Pirellulales bacterium]